jgi:hydroxylamine reductase (hybrid-cluster protein)
MGADKVIDAVRAKAIRHFFLVSGCTGEVRQELHRLREGSRIA